MFHSVKLAEVHRCDESAYVMSFHVNHGSHNNEIRKLIHVKVYVINLNSVSRYVMNGGL